MAGERKTTKRRTTAATAPQVSEYGHLQPQALELEEAVIGACLIEKDAFGLVSDILKPQSFYGSKHQIIFRAISTLAAENKPVDILTVTDQLRKTAELEEAGGPFYITELSNKVVSSAHIEYHARIIAQKALARELITYTSYIQTKAFDETQDIEELMQKGGLSEHDLDYIHEAFSHKSNDVEHLIKDVTKVISELTDYTSVAIGPHAEGERIRSLALLPCGDGRALLVIVTGERILRDSFIDIPENMPDEDLENASRVISKLFEGKRLSEAKDVEEQVLAEFGQYRQVMREVIDALKAYTRPREEDVVLSGQDKIFNHPEFEDIENVKNFLTVISSKDRIAELIGSDDDEIQINVKIGSCGDCEVPDDCSVVTATYSAGGKNLGTYGVIGPIRMDYTKVITVLENVGKALEGLVNNKKKDDKESKP